MYMYVCMYVCICMYICMYVYMHTDLCGMETKVTGCYLPDKLVNDSCWSACKHPGPSVKFRVMRNSSAINPRYTYNHIHTYIHTYINTYVHTYISEIFTQMISMFVGLSV